MITLKSSAEKVLDKDTESDQETVTEEDSRGGTRQSSKTSKKENTVYRTDSESNSRGSGSPYVSKELSPKIEGVVVIADGGENAVVKENISSAVQAAGYMNYSGKLFPGKTKTQETNSELANKELLDISDEDTSVSSGDIKSQDGDTGSTDGNASSTDDGSVDGTPGEAVLANGTVSSVAAQAKVSREQVRSKNKETLQSIIDNKNLSDAEKENAVNQMVQMTEIAEKEAAAESLLAAKGFNDSVVSITDDQADVIVGASELSDANRAQIEDIVTRKTGVAAQNIVINPVNADSK